MADPAIGVSAWFLRPVPMAKLKTGLSVLSEGGRVSVVDNTLWAGDDEQPCATVRVTLSRQRAVELPGFVDAGADRCDPTQFPAGLAGLPMAGPGSWMPWRRARAMTSYGSGSSTRSLTAPDRCHPCSARRTGPMASPGRCRTWWPIPTRT